MASEVPKIKLNNGILIPVLGLGTWRAEKGEVKNAVMHAIDFGYRHFDCAMFYGNESEVGSGIKEKISQGVVKRADLFIVSKLWCNAMRPDLVEPTLRKSLENFGLEYLDQYLVHWPTSFKEDGDFVPKDKNGKTIFSDVDYVDTWQAMEEVYKKGLTKSIGVSNFNIEQLKRLLQNVTIKPVVNQVEYHPYLNQSDLLSFCKSFDITITGYSPIGSSGRPWAKKSDPSVLFDPKIKKLAQKYKKTPAQISIRFLIQLGIVAIPKSTNRERLHENINIFDFELNSTEMETIETLNSNIRYHPHDDAIGHKNHPFN